MEDIIENGLKIIKVIKKYSRTIACNEKNEFFIIDNNGIIISDLYINIDYIKNNYAIVEKENPRDMFMHWSALYCPAEKKTYRCNESTMFVLDILSGETMYSAHEINTYDNKYLTLKKYSYKTSIIDVSMVNSHTARPNKNR